MIKKADELRSQGYVAELDVALSSKEELEAKMSQLKNYVLIFIEDE